MWSILHAISHLCYKNISLSMYYYHPYLQITKLKFKEVKCWLVSYSKLEIWNLNLGTLILEVTDYFITLSSNTEILFKMGYVPLITGVSKDLEKLEHLYTVVSNVKWYCHYGKRHDSFWKKLKVELLYDVAIPFLAT